MNVVRRVFSSLSLLLLTKETLAGINSTMVASPVAQVLRCQSDSISFDESPEALPRIKCQTTYNALKLAAHHLVDMEDVVAFPTETVYGLGANALNPSAIARIFSTKGRPSDNPLIVHVSSLEMLKSILPKGYEVPEAYKKLMDAFWPGALTLLFPSPPETSVVPKIVTAGHPTVAVRMPSHPVARALIATAGVPLAAPSANSSGKPSPTRAEHVLHDLGGKLQVILDAGPCAIGVESTVVDGLHEDGNLRVLRPGGVTIEDMERVLTGDGEPVSKVLVHHRDFKDEAMEQAPTTPGMKYRHYSPSVPVLLVVHRPANEHAFTSFPKLVESSFGDLVTTPKKIGLLAPSDSVLLDQLPPPPISVNHFALGSRNDPATIAARLYDGLLTLEREGSEVIIIEGIPEDREGLAFMNRVKKAAGSTKYVCLS